MPSFLSWIILNKGKNCFLCYCKLGLTKDKHINSQCRLKGTLRNMISLSGCINYEFIWTLQQQSICQNCFQAKFELSVTLLSVPNLQKHGKKEQESVSNGYHKSKSHQ